MNMDLLSFIVGAIAGGLVTYGVMRRLRSPVRPPLPPAEVIVSPLPVVPAAGETAEEKALDLDAQRVAAAARIRDQRAASRALREAQRLAAEEDARKEAQRLVDEDNARAEAQKWAAEERARAQEAQRLAAEAAEQAQAQAEAQRLAAEESARAQAQQLADQAAAQENARRLADEEAARMDAQRLADEAAAAVEVAAAAEAQRLAAEERARLEAQRVAQEAAEAATAAALPPAVAPPKEPKPPSETLVMIVDDSKVGRIKTNRLLLNHAFQVQMAVDGRDAVQKIAERMPDMVITDVEMPEMDGFELTLHIRQDPATAHLPVIIVSGNNDEYAVRAQEVGADFMLGKPYTDSDMIGHVQRLLRTGH